MPKESHAPLEQRVLEQIRKMKMLLPGDRVIVGLSAGPDSSCLLSVLCRLREELEITVRAVHVHHGLRGEEADRDEKAALELAEKNGVPCEVFRIDAGKEAKETGTTVEEAGRNARYRIFREVKDMWGGENVKIATAHHADDSAETVLMNLFRGTGLRGLVGIPAVSGDIIRPLIGETKAEIRNYLDDHGIRWMEDSTNLDTEITRNYIRQELLPAVERKVNERAADHILSAAEDIAEADAYFRDMAEWKCGRICRKAGGIRISCAEFPSEPPILRRYLVRAVLERLGCPAKDIGRVHIAQILDIIDGGTGRRTVLPYGVEVRKEYEDIIFAMEKRGEKSEKDRSGQNGGGADSSRGLHACFDLEVLPRNQVGKIADTTYTKCFDYDRIQGTLSFRYRTEGDRIRLSEHMTKSLRRLMIDEKVPRGNRDRIPVVANDDRILWVVGYRTDWDARVTEQTETILRITYNGG